jgi:hypothetical protein
MIEMEAALEAGCGAWNAIRRRSPGTASAGDAVIDKLEPHLGIAASCPITRYCSTQ